MTRINIINRGSVFFITSIFTILVLLLPNINCSKKKIGLPPANPEQLIEIIKGEQMKYVKKSFGVNAGECFTDEDLISFNNEKVPENIVSYLKNDDTFLNVVEAIKIMVPTQKEILLHEGDTTAQPTWSTLGRISSEGQTDAGRKAQLSIAGSIVQLVREKIR